MAKTNADRLDEISNELAGILEARIQELTTAMKGAEQVTRQIVATEMEIARYRQIMETMGGEVSGLQEEAAAGRARAEEARGAWQAAMAERDASRAEANRLDDQAEDLRREAAELRAKAKALEDSVARLRKVRDDGMSTVGGLEQQLGGLGLGGKK